MSSTAVKTPEFYDTAPVHISTTRVVRASPDDVFAALAATEDWAKWFPTIRRGYWTSSEPHGVGSTRSVHVGPVRVDEVFIVWEPGQRWGFSFVATTIPLVRAGAELVELEDAGDGTTRVTYNMYIDPLPGMGGMTRALRRGIAKGLGDGLKGLDRHLAGPR